MANVPLIKRCTGVNNRVDSKRLRQYDRETGVSDLAEGVNIDIDETGAISSRLGLVEISAISSHSCFQDKGDAFIVQDRTAENDAVLYRLNADFTLTGVQSGLVKAAKLSYFQLGATTFYSNGYGNGTVTGAVAAIWPATTYYGPTTLKDLSAAPVGTHIAFHKARAWVSVEGAIYCSEPNKPGLFRLAGRGFRFGTDVLMMRPVAGGVWVSDSETTGFISTSEKWDASKYVRKANVPAHEWSDNCRLVDLSESILKIEGLSAVWSSNDGMCVGSPNGELKVITEDNLLYPTGSSGATVVSDRIAINTVY